MHLLALGARVTACERNPAMLRLIQDALARAASDETIHTTVRRALDERFSLVADDARCALRAQRGFHAVLIDPMHPDVGRTAAVTREMRIVREVVGDDPDAAALLAAAIEAGPRTVVKLPRRAPPLLPAPLPAGSVMGRALRWDYYLPIR